MKSTRKQVTVIHSVIWMADIGVLIALPIIIVIYGLHNHDLGLLIPLLFVTVIVGLIGYFISQTRKVVVDSNKQLITINNGLGNTIDLPFGSITSVTRCREYVILNSEQTKTFKLNYNFYLADDQKRILSLIKEHNPKGL